MMRTAVGLFYKNILRHNLNNIPPNGAGILVANHSSSLMDAALLGIFIKRPVHFFARGDIFINPLVKKILKSLHMHPIHNHTAGKGSVGINDASIEIANMLLESGELVLFFPEGISHTDYRLLPFKKGAFRIAQQLIAVHPSLQLPIIPIGINYSDPVRLFSTVWIQAGLPLDSASILGKYEAQPAQALKALTDAAYIAIQKLVIDAENQSAEQLKLVMECYRNRLENASNTQGAGHFIQQEKVLNTSFLQWPVPTIDLVEEYNLQLEQSGFTDKEISAANQSAMPFTPLVIGMPATIIGWSLNALPLLLARRIADNKVTRNDFYSWILVTTAAILYVLWFLLLTILAFIFLPNWKALALIFIIISTGQYCWTYFRYFTDWRIQRKHRSLSPALLSSLQEMSARIIKSFPI